MDGSLEDGRRLRTIEEALADLVAKHQKQPSAYLARMIRQLEFEIAERKGIRRRDTDTD